MASAQRCALLGLGFVLGAKLLALLGMEPLSFASAGHFSAFEATGCSTPSHFSLIAGFSMPSAFCLEFPEICLCLDAAKSRTKRIWFLCEATATDATKVDPCPRLGQARVYVQTSGCSIGFCTKYPNFLLTTSMVFPKNVK